MQEKYENMLKDITVSFSPHISRQYPTRSIMMEDVIACEQKLDQISAASCLMAVGSALRTESRVL